MKSEDTSNSAGTAGSGKKTRLKLAIPTTCLMAVAAGLVVYGSLPDRAEDQPSLGDSAPNLSDHPIYGKYEFGGQDNVIDIGVQPLVTPTNIIVETMKRDAVLREALTREGLEIRFHPFLKGADLNFFLQRGDLEVGVAGDMPTLTAAAESQVLVAGLMQLGFCSVVAKKPLMMEELRGMRIAYALGSNAHHALLEGLASAGLTEEDVQLIPLDVDAMPDALAEGKIDAFSAWEPTPTIAMTRFPDLTVIYRSLVSQYLYFSRSFAEKHPRSVRHIVASQLRAIHGLQTYDEDLFNAARWARNAAQEMSDQASVLSVEQYVTLARNDLLGLSSAPAIPQSELAPQGRLFEEFEFLRSLGKIPRTAEWDEVRSCFDHTIIQEIVAQRQKYRLFTHQESNHGAVEP